MNRTTKIVVSALTFSIIAAASAISGPCCMNSLKANSSKKQCTSPNKPCDSTRHSDTIKNTAPDKTILFFLNPNGRPCQTQLAILDQMKEKLAPLAAITYIKTTESGDLDKFSKYGIRGLPSLIIVDNSGKELSRFQPGIQDEAAILKALGQKAR